MACSGTDLLYFTSEKNQHFIITKSKWLMLFKEIFAVYTVNHTNHIYTLLIVKATGIYNYHLVFKGLSKFLKVKGLCNQRW